MVGKMVATAPIANLPQEWSDNNGKETTTTTKSKTTNKKNPYTDSLTYRIKGVKGGK